MNNNEKIEEILKRLKASPEEILNYFQAEKLVLKDYPEGTQDTIKYREYENIVVITGGIDWVNFIDNDGKYHWVPIDKVDEIIFPKESKDFFIQLAIVQTQELVNQLINMRELQKKGLVREDVQ